MEALLILGARTYHDGGSDFTDAPRHLVVIHAFRCPASLPRNLVILLPHARDRHQCGTGIVFGRICISQGAPKHHKDAPGELWEVPHDKNRLPLDHDMPPELSDRHRNLWLAIVDGFHRGFRSWAYTWFEGHLVSCESRNSEAREFSCAGSMTGPTHTPVREDSRATITTGSHQSPSQCEQAERQRYLVRHLEQFEGVP